MWRSGAAIDGAASPAVATWYKRLERGYAAIDERDVDGARRSAHAHSLRIRADDYYLHGLFLLHAENLTETSWVRRVKMSSDTDPKL